MDKSFVASLNDPVVSIETLRIMGKALIDYRKTLDDEPAVRDAFDAAVARAFGGRFEGQKLISNYIDPKVMPRLSRVQAQLFVLDTAIQEWCNKQDAVTRQDAAIPPIMKMDEVEGLKSFGSNVHLLCEAIDNTLKIETETLTATRIR